MGSGKMCIRLLVTPTTGKHVLPRCNRIESPEMESNHRHAVYKSAALPLSYRADKRPTPSAMQRVVVAVTAASAAWIS